MATVGSAIVCDRLRLYGNSSLCDRLRSTIYDLRSAIVCDRLRSYGNLFYVTSLMLKQKGDRRSCDVKSLEMVE